MKLNFVNFCLLVEGSGSVQIITALDPGGPKTYESASETLIIIFEEGYKIKVRNEKVKFSKFALNIAQYLFNIIH